MAASIPRFLLPQRSPIWRLRTISSSTIVQSIRNASQNAATKTKAKVKTAPRVPVLGKPAKFNPPSHGAKLRKDPPRYPGPRLSSEQVKAQKTKKYPNMMPAEGTFMHWFLTNRSIHLYITLGTLFSLGGYASVTHFKRTSKFGDMLPPASDLFFHPIAFMRSCLEVLKLHSAAVSAEAAERRQRRLDDVAKRSFYRKKHGLETEEFGGWTMKGSENLGPAISSAEGDASPAAVAIEGENVEQPVQKPKRPVKKWLGIW